jgi:hypothetical protein
MMVKAEGFQIEGGLKSLGTSFGFEQADVLGFLAERTDEMIESYIDFNLIWDTLFGLIYGLMYVVWMSVLFKRSSEKWGYLNLLPLAQVIFDWLENYELASLASQYLAEGTVSSSKANLASIASMTKWTCSGLTYTLIIIGLGFMVARSVTKKRQPL